MNFRVYVAFISIFLLLVSMSYSCALFFQTKALNIDINRLYSENIWTLSNTQARIIKFEYNLALYIERKTEQQWNSLKREFDFVYVRVSDIINSETMRRVFGIDHIELRKDLNELAHLIDNKAYPDLISPSFVKMKRVIQELWSDYTIHRSVEASLKDTWATSQYYYIFAFITAILSFIFFIVMFFLYNKERMHVIQSNKSKLEALGRLSAGVAHNFNSPLGAISGFCHIAREKFGDVEELVTISRAARHLESVTARILAFSKIEQKKLEKVNIVKFLNEGRFLLDEAAQQCGLKFDFHDDSIIVKTRPESLLEILINLIQNASEASKIGGNITIKTYTKITKELVISVEDEGKGMEKELINKIREMFFTTKPVGTGLGLAICEELAKTIGASIYIESEKGVGTKVQILLPAP